MKAVVILGAGASAGFGLPTLKDIFKDARAQAYLHENDQLRTTLRELIWRPRGRSLATSDRSLNIEEILSLLRDAERQGDELGELMSSEDILIFRRSLYVLIKKAIYDGRNSTRSVLNPLIAYMRRPEFEHVTWASFNWDCMFEASFYYTSGDPGERRLDASLVIDVNGWGASRTRRHTFLKLHGGINWWYENDRVTYLRFTRAGQLDEKWRQYETEETDGQPLILEPSYYKYSGKMYRLLKPQWEHLIGALVEAECVVVVGYSLPESDSAARSAISLGFQLNPQAKWLVIYPDRWVCERYGRLLGMRRFSQIIEKIEDVNERLHVELDQWLSTAG